MVFTWSTCVKGFLLTITKRGKLLSNIDTSLLLFLWLFDFCLVCESVKWLRLLQAHSLGGWIGHTRASWIDLAWVDSHKKKYFKEASATAFFIVKDKRSNIFTHDKTWFSITAGSCFAIQNLRVKFWHLYSGLKTILLYKSREMFLYRLLDWFRVAINIFPFINAQFNLRRQKMNSHLWLPCFSFAVCYENLMMSAVYSTVH